MPNLPLKNTFTSLKQIAWEYVNWFWMMTYLNLSADDGKYTDTVAPDPTVPLYWT